MVRLGVIKLTVVPIRGSEGQWHGRKLIIEAAGRLYAYARSTYHSLKKFLHFTERANLPVEPTPLREGFKSDYPTFPHYILSDVPFWENSASLEGYKSFKEALGRL